MSATPDRIEVVCHREELFLPENTDVFNTDQPELAGLPAAAGWLGWPGAVYENGPFWLTLLAHEVGQSRNM